MTLPIRILIGLMLGLICGVLASGHYFHVTALISSLPNIIEPIGKLWVNAIRMVVIPLLVSLLITSIAGHNNKTNQVAKLSGKTIGLFVFMIVISSFYTFLLAPSFLSFLSLDPQASQGLLASSATASVASTELPAFSSWFINLIPSNPIRAAADSATLPLMIFTALLSMALLKIESEKRLQFVGFFEALKQALFVLINWIMLVAPIGIFALVFPLAATLGVSAITLLGSFIGIACLLIVIMTLLLYPIATIVGRVPFKFFVRTLIPVQIIGFSTRSSLASLPATIDATEKLGVSSKTSGVVLPFAVTMLKFASPIARTTGTYFIAMLYGIDLSIIQLVIVALAIGLLSFYSPGIPSGGLLIMAPIYSSLGLPIEGIGILIAVDLIVDMFITASNVTANVTAAILMSRSDRTR
ncbi:MAG: dicarboxylate/amino acid:cation symporter [Marinicellaceae bacterium]